MFSFFSSGTNGFFSCEFYQRLFRALIILFIALQISPLIIFDNSSFLGPFLQGFGWRATKAKVIMEERVVEEHIHLRTKRMILKWIFANDKLTKQQNCLREGIKKIDFFLGNSPKQRTPPSHPYGLGLT